MADWLRRSQHKKFSILKYGEQEAYRKALAARETAFRALSAHTFLPFEAPMKRGTR